MTAAELKNIAYIALGSNIGDKLYFIKLAVSKINQNENCGIIETSSVYETKPYGNKDQDNFLNATVKIRTDFQLLELLDFLKGLERELGRQKSSKWGPREIDLDLLFYNNAVYSDERLTVPHREIEHRDFVLVPLCEIASEFIHPALNKKICDICISDSETSIIRRLPDKIF